MKVKQQALSKKRKIRETKRKKEKTRIRDVLNFTSHIRLT